MRAYVTGASGFIGAHVARELRERGGEVYDEWIDLGDRERLRSAIEGVRRSVPSGCALQL